MNRATAAAALLLLGTAALAADASTVLHRLPWRASLPGRHLAGTACWLVPGDGAWRLEIAQRSGATGDDAWSALLSRRGEGWCVLAGLDGTVYLAGWGQPLRPLSAPAASRLRLLVRLATGERTAELCRPGDPVPVAVPRFPRAWLRHQPSSGPQPAWLVRWPRSVTAGNGAEPGSRSLRDRLVGRGRGRGGAGETWRLVPLPAGGWRLTSSRLPGQLLLGTDRPVEVVYDADLIYLPDLPLADLLRELP